MKECRKQAWWKLLLCLAVFSIITWLELKTVRGTGPLVAAITCVKYLGYYWCAPSPKEFYAEQQ